MGTTNEAGDGAARWPLRPFGPPPHKWERSLSVLDSGDGQAVADRDHDALQPGMLRDELVVRRDILRLLVLRCNDLALAQSVVGHQKGTTLEASEHRVARGHQAIEVGLKIVRHFNCPHHDSSRTVRASAAA